MVTAKLLPMGERAFLLEVDSLPEVLAVHGALAASRPDGVVDLVPAARSVLVRFDPHVLAPSVARSWATAKATDAAPGEVSRGELVEIDTAYDGADLADTARLLGVEPDELVARHCGVEWTVAFTGFAPGFAYLVSDEWPFDVPRLDSPRTRVPAGAVGLAGGFSGAYPRETPGGWRLIGTTSARLFDPDAASPALLAPGTRVRFRRAGRPAEPPALTETGVPAEAGGLGEERPVPAGTPVLDERGAQPVPTESGPPQAGPGQAGPAQAGSARAAEAQAGPANAAEAPAQDRAVEEAGETDAEAAARRPGIRIVEPGLLATLQDLGRPGAASIGVAVSGALDRAALRTANRLVGNLENAAGLEVTMGGLRAVAERDVWVAVTGAWGPVRIGGHDVDPYQAHEWPAGAELRLDWFVHGARAYVAVRGGLDGPAVLGSRATDLLAGLGPAALRAGDVIRVRSDEAGPIPVAPPAAWGVPHDDEVELELAPGPRVDWFEPGALDVLFDAVWTVSNAADRVGARLEGPELPRARHGELPSEGMVPGALQVPPSGRPTILLADGPVTGGYPVIAVVTDASLDALAQARPGTRVRFRHAPAHR